MNNKHSILFNETYKQTMNHSVNAPLELNMESFHKSIPKIVNLIFAIVFFIHIAIIGYRRAYPENPSVRVYDKDLKDIEFPLSFKICVREQYGVLQRYQDIGYYDIYAFFRGQPSYNRRYFGWAGRDRNKSTLGTVTG